MKPVDVAAPPRRSRSQKRRRMTRGRRGGGRKGIKREKKSGISISVKRG